MVKSYQDLLVWQKAMDLVVISYQLAEKLAASEVYGLAGSIRRRSSSVPSYIADGFGRDQTNEYISRLSVAYGSLMALETHLLTTERLSFLTRPDIETALKNSAEVGKMLNGLMSSLKRSNRYP